ncbi:MAG: branched-chain amino acid ABC transporter permease, partial [Actinobacteria bacterium]|nr:branched-chain amino acid ABC transporter permease [Actinomycetota bacterium]
LPPAVTDRATVVAAVVGAGVATLGAEWPANLGMLIGAASGVVAGTVTALRTPDPARAEVSS